MEVGGYRIAPSSICYLLSSIFFRRHPFTPSPLHLVTLAPQVRFDHTLVGRNGIEAALGNLLAIVERNHTIGDTLDQAHVVFDDQDGIAATRAQFADQV